MDRRKILLVVAVVVAALGAGLVFVYASGAEDRARDDLKTVPVLVAIKTIQPGESASDAADAGKLLTQQVPADQAIKGSTNDGKDFTGAIALTTIYPGEQLVTQKFGTIDEIEGKPTLPIPKGKTAITLKLSDTGRVSSFTQPGSHVAVYFAPDPAALVPEDETGGTGGTDTTTNDVVQVTPACVIESDLLVLGVGTVAVDNQTTTDGERPDSGETVALMTVAVDSAQASSLIGFQIAAEREGQALLAFALRNDESKITNNAACTAYLDAIQGLLEMSESGSGAGTESNG